MPESLAVRIPRVMRAGADFATARRFENAQKSHIVEHAIRCAADALYLHEMRRVHERLMGRIVYYINVGHSPSDPRDAVYLRKMIEGIAEVVFSTESGEAVSSDDKQIFDKEVDLLSTNLLKEFNKEFPDL